jgi:hypothetical protein
MNHYFKNKPSIHGTYTEEELARIIYMENRNIFLRWEETLISNYIALKQLLLLLSQP